MNRLRYTTSVSLVPPTFAFCLAGVSDLLLAQDRAIDIPENAHLDYSGRDWECAPPYRRRQNNCALPYMIHATGDIRRLKRMLEPLYR